MKLHPIIIAVLCCLLIAGQSLMAQEFTAPPPPPGEVTSTPPPPNSSPGSTANAANAAGAAANAAGAAANAALNAANAAANAIKNFFSKKSPPKEAENQGSGNQQAAARQPQGSPAQTGTAGQEDTPARQERQTKTGTPSQAGTPGQAEATGQAGTSARQERQARKERQKQERQAKAGAADQADARSSSTLQRKGLYGGVLFGQSLPSYDGSGDDYSNLESKGQFQFGGFLGLHLGKIGLQADVLTAFEEVTADQGDIDAFSLLVPIVVKYDINFGRFVIQPLLGAYFDIALGKLHVKTSEGREGKTDFANPPGITFGSDFGWKFKKGMLFLDARYIIDLGKTVYADRGNEETLWSKTAFALSLGYQFN